MQKIFALSVLGFLLLPVFVLVAEPPGVEVVPPATPPGVVVTPPPANAFQKLPNPLGATNTFEALAAKILVVVSDIGGIVAVFFIIYAGFLFATAGANDKKLGDAKKAILYAVIGTAILLGAQALAKILEATINSLK